MHFFIAYFLSEISKYAAETSHIVTVAYLLKHDKFGSNFVLIKQNLSNSIILPPKNGGFKARSHSVRKAIKVLFIISMMATYCFNLAAILAVSVMHSSSRVITRDQQAKIADTQTCRVALILA